MVRKIISKRRGYLSSLLTFCTGLACYGFYLNYDFEGFFIAGSAMIALGVVTFFVYYWGVASYFQEKAMIQRLKLESEMAEERGEYEENIALHTKLPKLAEEEFEMLKSLLIKNKLSEAIDYAENNLSISHNQRKIFILHKNNFLELEREKNKGTVSDERYRVRRNQLLDKLLDLFKLGETPPS